MGEWLRADFDPGEPNAREHRAKTVNRGCGHIDPLDVEPATAEAIDDPPRATSYVQDPVARSKPREASMVKLFVTETAQKAALEGMQMMGGYGYSSEYDMERLVRQTLVSTIYGGTSEIQRNIIAKTLGL